MNIEKTIDPIVRDKETNALYRQVEGNRWENLTTSKFGDISNKEAKQRFVIPLRLNDFALRNPNLISLIKNLNLKLEE